MLFLVLRMDLSYCLALQPEKNICSIPLRHILKANSFLKKNLEINITLIF